MQDKSFKPFVIVCLAIVVTSNGSEHWVSSNSKGALGNLCGIDYKMPVGFVKNDELAAKQNALAILSLENGNTSQFIALDFKSSKEAPDSFEGCRKQEKEFLRQYKVDVDVEILRDGHFITNEKETIYEKWASNPKTYYKVYKKVYKVKKIDGYYDISFNGDNLTLLDSFPFDEFLKSIKFECKEK